MNSLILPSGLTNLGHEGGDAFELGVAGADASENGVNDRHRRRIFRIGGRARDEAAHLRHHHQHPHRPNVGRLREGRRKKEWRKSKG